MKFALTVAFADNIDNVLVLLSTVLSLVILSLRHQTGIAGGSKYGGRIGQEIEKKFAGDYR
ncbi:MAG TPA: hypothetical protein VLI91_10975, partial [Roseiarcus sp.]|nr:hypothetical protein [Roseiarcus sp.]